MKPQQKRTTTTPGLGETSTRPLEQQQRERLAGSTRPSERKHSSSHKSPPQRTQTFGITPAQKNPGSTSAQKEAESHPPMSQRSPRGAPIDRDEEEGRIERVEHVEHVESTCANQKKSPAATNAVKATIKQSRTPTMRGDPPVSRTPTMRGDPPVSRTPTMRGNPDTGTRRRTLSNRAAVAVDDLGSGLKKSPDAVGLASRTVPRIVKTKAEIAAAPIDHRAGFLLAHIDGKTTVQAIVDIAGMPEQDVHEILERLRRLGIVAIR
jgi:hypothetical protein